MHQWKFSHSSSLTDSKNLCHYSEGRNMGETLNTGGFITTVRVAPHSQYKQAGLRIIIHLSSSNVSTGITWQSTFHGGRRVILQISHCLLIFTVNMRSLLNARPFTHFWTCFSFFHQLSLSLTHFLKSCEFDNWQEQQVFTDCFFAAPSTTAISFPCMMKTKTSQCLITKVSLCHLKKKKENPWVNR